MDDFPHRVEALRPQLLRYARSQLRNDAWAEDAVSDTLLAALERPQGFQGQSQLKTWLIGILKHKLVDQLRRHQREATVLDRDDAEPIEDLLFDQTGHWRECPADWQSQPEARVDQHQFLAVLDACVDHLPAAQGRVFLMREWLELDSDEICHALSITSSHLWVLLHRARLRLRECLQQRWFTPPQRVGSVTMKRFNLNCREATLMVLHSEDVPLGPADRLRLRWHLFICRACPRFVRQVALMRRAMGPWRAYRDGD